MERDEVVFYYRQRDAVGIIHMLRTEISEYTKTFYGEEHVLAFHHYRFCDGELIRPKDAITGELPTCLLCYRAPCDGLSR